MDHPLSGVVARSNPKGDAKSGVPFFCICSIKTLHVDGASVFETSRGEAFTHSFCSALGIYTAHRKRRLPETPERGGGRGWLFLSDQGYARQRRAKDRRAVAIAASCVRAKATN